MRNPYSQSCLGKNKITPSQKDPKQQELRIHLRPRLDLGPYGGLVSSRTLKTLKKQLALLHLHAKNVEKQLVLFNFRSKRLKKSFPLNTKDLLKWR